MKLTQKSTISSDISAGHKIWFASLGCIYPKPIWR